MAACGEDTENFGEQARPAVSGGTLFPFPVVPEMQFHARTGDTTPADNDTNDVAKNLSRRIHAQFPPWSQNRFPQHFEATKFPQGQTKINFFTDKILLLEAANRIKVASRCEKKCARAEIEPEVNGA